MITITSGVEPFALTNDNGYITGVELKLQRSWRSSFFRLVINNKKNPKREVVISPYSVEFYASTDVLYIKPYCDKHNIKVTGICKYNFIPAFSLFCDEIIAYKKPVGNTCHWYDSHVSNNDSRMRLWSHPDWEYTDERQLHPKIIDNWPFPKKPWLIESALKETNIEEIIEYMTNSPIHIPEDTFQCYKQAEGELQKDQVLCEGGNKFAYIGNAARSFIPEIPEITKERPMGTLQKQLLQKNKDRYNHYLGMQILASLFNNWRYIAAGGCANLLGYMPIKSPCMAERLLCSRRQKIIHGIRNIWWGEIGKELPIIIQNMKLAASQIHDNKDLIFSGLKLLSQLTPPTLQYK